MTPNPGNFKIFGIFYVNQDILVYRFSDTKDYDKPIARSEKILSLPSGIKKTIIN